MRIFSGPPQAIKNKPVTAKACLIANALVLPGLGSLMRGRKAGSLQVTASLIGLLLSIYATKNLVQFIGKADISPTDTEAAIAFVREAGKELSLAGAGLAILGFAWLWSLLTSWSLFKEDREAKRTLEKCEPSPRIDAQRHPAP